MPVWCVCVWGGGGGVMCGRVSEGAGNVNTDDAGTLSKCFTLVLLADAQTWNDIWLPVSERHYHTGHTHSLLLPIQRLTITTHTHLPPPPSLTAAGSRVCQPAEPLQRLSHHLELVEGCAAPVVCC